MTFSARFGAFAATLVAIPAVAMTDLPAADVTLLPGWRLENGHHMAALRVVLEPEWKTYWRAPGEGGIPPQIDWAASENLADVRFYWPVPEAVELGGMTSIVYQREMILPIELTAVQPGAEIRVEADVLLGICKDICVPVQTELAASLAPGGAPDPVIQRALDARPDTPQEAGVSDVLCSVAPITDGIRVTARIDMPALGPDEFVVFEAADEAIWVSEAMTDRAGDVLTSYADFVPPDAKPFDISAADVRLTVLGAGRGVDIQGCALDD